MLSKSFYSGLSLFSYLASIPLANAINCGEINQRAQHQPESYLRTSNFPHKPAFAVQEIKNRRYNAEIPPPCEQAIRILTFNIQVHRDLWGERDNNESIKLDLLKLKPAVAVFQKVILDEAQPQRKSFDLMLQSLGFRHIVMTRKFDQEARIGNMIASVFPLARIVDLDLRYKRALVAVKVMLPPSHRQLKDLIVMGTHLEMSSATTRLWQVARIDYLLKRHIRPNYSNIILCGDLNAEARTSEIETLMATSCLQDSFRATDALRPSCTFWDGRSVDYILVSKSLVARLYGSYVYHTLSSDHLPLIVDIASATQYQRLDSRYWALFRLGVVSIEMLVALFALGVVLRILVKPLKTSP